MIESRADHSIYVPDEPAPLTGWPVIFVLHGAGRNHRTVIDSPELRANIERRRVMIVFPDGGMSFWLGRQQQRVRELMPANSSRVGICGWSMGGFGAVRFAEDFPEKIAAVGAVIGLLDYPNPQLPAEQNFSFDPVAGYDARAINCLAGAERLRGKPIGIITARQAFDFQMNENFHARLDELGIAHRYEVLEGKHDWPVVVAGLPRLLDFVTAALG